ncbi:hypothetical protein BPTFM16_02820 [Altererythrobacter insulae]|nr:hypothetical protein BPTFM16_02820 [Altererythrobacter insulae]
MAIAYLSEILCRIFIINAPSNIATIRFIIWHNINKSFIEYQ